LGFSALYPPALRAARKAIQTTAACTKISSTHPDFGATSQTVDERRISNEFPKASSIRLANIAYDSGKSMRMVMPSK
jgi:hypothetical protein